ncbi:MAG: radical SAM protein, partial [Candidatus Omnitrophota bacterium]|nr:radical SAM protein [Candidatus Omnitrophota bacterium]
PALPSLGVGYIASFLKSKGIDVKILDAYAEGLNIEAASKIVKEINPDIVGFSVLTPAVPMSLRLAEAIKNNNKNIIIVFGGIHPSLMPDETLQSPYVDFVVRGEGEITFYELVKALRDNPAGVEGVKGVSYRRNGAIQHNPDREYIKDLDSLPHIEWEMFPMDKYRCLPHWKVAEPFYPMITSRGCPARCTFCSLSTQGKVNRSRSARNVADELESLVKNKNARQILVLDASFPVSKERAFELLDEIIKRGLHKKLAWTCETRVNFVDYLLMKKMREAGCRKVAFGIESGVQELLDNVKKGFRLDAVRKAVKSAKEAGLEVIAFYMFGLPGETIEMSMKTIDFAIELNTDIATFSLTVPYPGTELYEQAKKEGLLKTIDWEKYSSLGSMTPYEPAYVPKGMTKEELVYIQQRAIKRYYFRPGMILMHIKKLRSFDDLMKYINTFITIAKGFFLKAR